MPDQNLHAVIRTYLERANEQAKSHTTEHFIELDSVQFLRERLAPGYCLELIEYAYQDGGKRQDSVLLTQDAQGRLNVLSGGAQHVDEVPIIFNRANRQDTPFLRLGWQTWPNGPFCARGAVIEKGFEVTRVRLIDANGSHLESDVQNHLVLFLSEQVLTPPFTIEFYNRAGEIIGIEVTRQ
ncbi:hypothetical protein [Tengunoibacter tsumagoiensis]|uniref:Uncharacterized protein n=1 Tax=Tengunoibacter tsumagoiensis TaxID=2014871 RepID=A0A401ZVD8_9CHLR|nr:hypothetical protein [Tengunoibacter tsumagoiensis]GCE10762.1 hypothetical protein KTT_06210 [Tengunoibacter tsumagoiensis]